MSTALASLSPEARLLLETAADESAAPSCERQIEKLDWSRLAYLAEREGATVVLWRWLEKRGAAVPADLARRWQSLAMVAEFQMRHLERLLHQALDVLARDAIPALLLKGSALAYTHYGAFTDRPMGDLDLLVPADLAPDAWALLQTHGWTWPAAAWPAERYATHQHLPPLVNACGRDARLEIHSELLPAGHPFHWPVRDVWARAQPLDGPPALVPHARDQLLHLCVHFAWSHELQWGGWRTLRDVTTIARRSDVDWRRLVEDARAAKATTCCFWTLRLAHSAAGARVPADALEALRPPRAEFLLRRLERHYLRQLFETERSCPSESLTKALWDFGIAPRWNHHGASRPWHVSDRLGGAPRPASDRTWPQRVITRARRAAHAVGYLRRMTAT